MKQGIFFFFWSASLLVSCASESGQQTALPYLTLEGQTMGTYYRVTYGDAQQRDFQGSIDSLLQAINLEVSTYIPEATISRFNQAEVSFDLRTDPRSGEAGAYANRHFLPNFLKAKEVYAQTEGYFDPTVMPLVNYWGFGYTPKKPVEQADSAKVQELLLLVGFGQVELLVQGEDTLLQKARPGVQLDFSAIAKGYGVDEVGRFLAAQGIENFLVDIGGEALSRGRSPRGDAWRIGINRPQEDAAVDEIQVAVPLDNRAIATSGNYRNFYEVDGLKYSHTINPKTGFPERNTLLSASVFAPDCMTADAFATAFMTMGLERAFALANQLPDIEAYFIYGLPDGGMATRYTPALAPLFEE
jgi:FAD:protein FMN transferase